MEIEAIAAHDYSPVLFMRIASMDCFYGGEFQLSEEFVLFELNLTRLRLSCAKALSMSSTSHFSTAEPIVGLEKALC